MNDRRCCRNLWSIQTLVSQAEAHHHQHQKHYQSSYTSLHSQAGSKAYPALNIGLPILCIKQGVER